MKRDAPPFPWPAGRLAWPLAAMALILSLAASGCRPSGPAPKGAAPAPATNALPAAVTNEFETSRFSGAAEIEAASQDTRPGSAPKRSKAPPHFEKSAPATSDSRAIPDPIDIK